MKLRKKMSQVFFVMAVLSMAITACKKKEKEQLFPDPPNSGNGGGLSGSIVGLPFSDNFNHGTSVAEFAIPSKWAEAIVDGSKTDRGWAYRNTMGKDKDGAMVASAKGGSNGMDNAFLITGPFNFSAYPTINVKFDFKGDFWTDPGTLKVVYSTNYGGGATTEETIWNDLTQVNTLLPDNDNSWKEIIADLSSIRDNKVYIAFHYKGGTASASKRFIIDNFLLSNTTITPGGNTGTGGNGSLSPTSLPIPYSDDLNRGTTVSEYAIPDKWLEEVVPGFKTDRGWAYRPTHGKSNSGALVASSFAGTVGYDKTYLITGPFDFSAHSLINMKFDLKSSHSANPGTLKVMYSTNYSGAGNAEASGVTWTELSDITGKIPSTDDQWAEIVSDLSAINGNKVYIAFFFEGGSEKASRQFVLDNFMVSNTDLGSGSTPGGGTNPGGMTLPFVDAFDHGTTVADYAIPTNWKEAFVAGSATNRGWAYRNNLGKNSTGAMVASAFVNASATPATDNVYLVTGPFNLAATTTRNLEFDYKFEFASDPGTFAVKYSTNYSGSGDPEAAVWNTIDISSQLPTAESTWKTITADIASVAGSNVYFAFHFKDGTSTKSKRFTIDNVSIAE
jgi:hypothetical protein